MPSTSALRLSGASANCWVREKARSWRVSFAARSVASAAKRAWRNILSSSLRRSIISRLPDTTVSRLLKSCAIPPVNWPTASIFCDWTSAVCARSRSATSSINILLARDNSLVRSAIRVSRLALRCVSRSSASCSAASRSRASYCRRRTRIADRTALPSVSLWMGRSSTMTLPSRSSTSMASRGRCPARRVASRMKGKSDHGGCCATQASSALRSAPASDSSVMIAVAAP